MDSFESIVRTILESQGYWVKSCFKVELTKKEKCDIGRPSCPRWELDLVAFKGSTREILVIECKSYLNSRGVVAKDLTGGKNKTLYKLFNEERLRKTVLARLQTQLMESGSCPADSKVQLCLAAGRVATDKDRAELQRLFRSEGWRFFSDRWVREELQKLAQSRYENDVAILSTKLLMHDSPPPAQGVST